MKVVIYAQEEPPGIPLDGLAGALREHGVEPLVAAAPRGKGPSLSAIGTLAACLSEAERAVGDAAVLIGVGDWPLTGAIAGLKASVPVLRVAGGRPEGADERTAALLALLAPVAIAAQDPEAAASDVAERLRARS